jgi:hypothetical protein
MKRTILSDLYGLHLEKINREKEVFLRKNLALEYAPYTEYLAKIPDHLLNCEYKYSVKVIYKKKDPVNSYNQTWSVTLKNNDRAPTTGKEYIVYPSLYTEVAAIIEREQEIKKEKGEMDAFIENTFDVTTGSKQIRRMWPESLHKYLPAEPVPVKRQKNSQGKLVLPTITAPSQLKTRLVNNLLEK